MLIPVYFIHFANEREHEHRRALVMKSGTLFA